MLLIIYYLLSRSCKFVFWYLIYREIIAVGKYFDQDFDEIFKRNV